MSIIPEPLKSVIAVLAVSIYMWWQLAELPGWHRFSMVVIGATLAAVATPHQLSSVVGEPLAQAAVTIAAVPTLDLIHNFVKDRKKFSAFVSRFIGKR